jgi:transposase
MRVPIHVQREVARLHFHDPRQSQRAIAKAASVSSSTAGKLRRKLIDGGHTWADLEALDDDEWSEKLDTRDKSIAKVKTAPDWAWVQQQMLEPDATLHEVWREWRGFNPTGIAYTQFTTLYGQWLKSRHVTMRRLHSPGLTAFVDFAGRTLVIHDPQGGPSMHAKIFVGVLGFSNYTYIEAVASEKVADWVACHANFFEEIGGVPRWIVPDNLKSAVTGRSVEGIKLNPVYRSCLAHFGTAANPAGPRKPKHKAKAEVGVQIVQRWILFPLRHQKFFSLAEANAELRRRCQLLNAHPFKKMAGSREQRFFEVEHPILMPLPQRRYEYAEWRYEVRVNSDHHIDFGGGAYSVPYQLIGETVDIKVTERVIEIFRRNRLVATHARLNERGASSTRDEHRPVAHRRVLDGEPAALLAWAAAVGPNALAMIRHHVEQRDDVTNGLNSARAMRNLARQQSDQRFEDVCAYALARNITTIKSIRSILQSSADRRPPKVISLAEVRATHQFVRGADYYSNPGDPQS